MPARHRQQEIGEGQNGFGVRSVRGLPLVWSARAGLGRVHRKALQILLGMQAQASKEFKLELRKEKNKK